MIDLNEIVNESLKKIEEEKFVQGVVEKALKHTLADIIDSTFRTYGDFGKSLEKYVKEHLNVNLDNLGLDGYNGLVLTAIKEQLDTAITIQGIEKIKEATSKLLKSAKSEYTLSEIIEKIKDSVDKDDVSYDAQLTLIIEKSSSGYYHIYLDEEDEKSMYSCDYQIAIDTKGTPYSIQIKEKDINTNKILGGLYGMDALLFKIYSAGSKIVFDKGECSDNYDLDLREDND